MRAVIDAEFVVFGFAIVRHCLRKAAAYVANLGTVAALHEVVDTFVLARVERVG